MAKRKHKNKKEDQKPEDRFVESSKPERSEETNMQPEQMGDIFVPDRSGISGIRDRGR